MKEKFKRVLILSLVWLLVLTPGRFGWAQEVTPPPEPTPTQGAPSPEAEPTAPPSPETPTITEALSPTPTPTAIVTEEDTLPAPTPTLSPETVAEVTPADHSNEIGNNQVGETVVTTEEATNSVVLVTSGNTNENTNESQTVVEEESVVATDSASVSETEGESTSQENEAKVANVLEQTTNTGGNSASKNVGDSRVETGDANTSGTVITALNTNLDGVAFNEYNLTGEQTGDLVLDFEENCLADETGVPVKKVEQSESFQTNEAELENTLVLASDSGDNQASFNTQGDSTVQTGDANVAATVLTFLNNNLAGNVTLAVVNIFGTLIGDIVFPQEALETQAEPENREETSASFQNNEAVIENNLLLSANTGENEARLNTGGETTIETGEATAETQVVNVANNNLAGGSWWLVLINVAGEWVGKILGAPEGANFAAALGTEFEVDENGDLNVNFGETNESTLGREVTQTNEAQVVNNLQLSANTGHNETSKNTGGNSTIKTGNARIVASLLNFVNNNISSQSKVFLTVVNVFGRWLGDFRPPGSEEETPPPPSEDDNNQPPESPATEEEEIAIDFGEEEEAFPWEEEIAVQGQTLAARLLPALSPENQGVLAQASQKADLEKPIRINLAWLAVTLPLFFLASWLKKYFV